MTFSGENSRRKRGWAKNFRLPTNFRIFSTASCFFIANGRIMSGTAPLGICWFIDSLLRHQWQRAWVLLAVSMTTSAPHAEHLNVRISSVEGVMSAAPEPMTTPLRALISLLRLRLSVTESVTHSNRQKEHRSFPVAGLSAISVAPQRRHFTSPSVESASVWITWGAEGSPPGTPGGACSGAPASLGTAGAVACAGAGDWAAAGATPYSAKLPPAGASGCAGTAGAAGSPAAPAGCS